MACPAIMVWVELSVLRRRRRRRVRADPGIDMGSRSDPPVTISRRGEMHLHRPCIADDARPSRPALLIIVINKGRSIPNSAHAWIHCIALHCIALVDLLIICCMRPAMDAHRLGTSVRPFSSHHNDPMSKFPVAEQLARA